MTVKELIEKLEGYPENHKVMIGMKVDIEVNVPNSSLRCVNTAYPKGKIADIQCAITDSTTVLITGS